MGNRYRYMICAVYKIYNKINRKIYIGSSINIKKRFSDHKNKLKKNKHHNNHLQNAWNKYGNRNFEFKIIEICDKTLRLQKEQFYLDNINPEYNIALSSSAPMEGRKHSKKTIRIFKNRDMTYLIKIAKKRKWTKAQRLARAKLRKGYRHSEKTKKKMSKIAKKLKRFTDLLKYIETKKLPIKDSEGNKFKSLSETAKFWNINVATVCDILKGRHDFTRNGVTFEYA